MPPLEPAPEGLHNPFTRAVLQTATHVGGGLWAPPPLPTQKQQQTERGSPSPSTPQPQPHWDQARPYVPPPYRGVLGGIAASGLHEADPQYDAIPKSDLMSGVHSAKGASLPDVAPPDWGVEAGFDWSCVERGQRLWRRYQGIVHTGLANILLVGFCLARSADVLIASGYSASPRVAYDRYLQTGFFVIDWVTTDLQDPLSLARISLKKVRAMHSLGRRKAAEAGLFSHASEGVPISQYDMALTLLAFTGCSLEWLMHICPSLALSEQDLGDMVSVFRVVGHFLGVSDRFNTCRTLQFNRCAYTDLQEWMGPFWASETPTSSKLRSTVLSGLAQHQPPGGGFWGANLELYLEQLGVIRLVVPRRGSVEPARRCASAMVTPFSLLFARVVHAALPWLNRIVSDRLCVHRTMCLQESERFARLSKRKRSVAVWCNTWFFPAGDAAMQAILNAVRFWPVCLSVAVVVAVAAVFGIFGEVAG
eukprot:TRINITY_DN7868_c0_g1_i1.p1 TRINITY_DN7868_c0_g1~~TRINITY_DN7868_c0_g1_i1.p1  ORF type:complete len:478 (+),score=88.14 TRINITY_DN7868_c0_g1_i1:145-1578(+)